jgi:PKD repeat protein
VDDPTGPAVLVFQHAASDNTLGPVQQQSLNAEDSVAPSLADGRGGGAVLWVADKGAVGAVGDELELTLFAPDGTLRTTVTLDRSFSANAGVKSPAVAVDDAGNALAVWTNGVSDGTLVAHAERVSAAGAQGSVVALGAIPSGVPPLVAVAPGGTGWASWVGSDGKQKVARILPGDTGLSGSSVASVGPGAGLESPSLVATAGGAAVTGFIRLDGIRGWRLPLTGDVLGTQFAVPLPIDSGAIFGSPAIGADGTTTVTSGSTLTTAYYESFAPGESSAEPHVLASAPGSSAVAVGPVVPEADGATLASWLVLDSQAGATMESRTIAADGTLSDPLAIDLPVAQPQLGGADLAHVLPLTPTDDGGAIIAIAGVPIVPITTPTISTAVLDPAPPHVTVSSPDSVVVAEPADLSATATDRSGIRSMSWDFGDGSGASGTSGVSVHHRYALVGDYDVTLTATDGAGNVTTVKRSIDVMPTPIPGGGGGGTPGGGGSTPGGGDGTGSSRAISGTVRTAAALRLTSAVRSGSKATVRGTITAHASGRVTLVYRQKAGRRTLTAKATARIVKGRFVATLRLSRALARRYPLKPTITATYTGNAATKPASTHRTVTAASKPRSHRARRPSRRRAGK